MDDVDGLRVSPSSEVDHGSGLPSTDTEEIDSPKTPFPRDSGFSNNTPSIKMLMNYNSVNGDCVEKDVNQSEQSLVASSSNNSLFSESPDVTRDSLPEDVNRLDSESSSDNSSKSSGSELSEAQLNYSFSKSSDNSSPLHHSTSFASDSSSDSDDLSDSEEERSSSKDREERKRVDTPDTHSSQSFQHDLPKSSPLVSNECEKDHESAEQSQSDDSFKKKERSHPLFNTLDESITSESSTGDSIETPRPSLTSSVSQDVSLPLEEGSDAAILQKDNNTVTKSEEVSDIQPIFKENLDSGTIAEIPLPEEGSNLLPGVLEENNPNSNNNIVEASQEIKDVSPLPKESNDPKLYVDEESNSKTKNVDESIEKKLVESSQPGESLQVKEALIPVKSDVNKPFTESSESEKNEDLMELSTTTNDTSIVKPCTSSCFPNIDNTLNIGRRPSTDHKSNNENEFSKIAKTFSIKYKGFKKIGRVVHPKKYKKSFLRWNPFNPARKKDPKTGKYILQSVTDEQDSSSLQPEYAQYLGLQPTVKFKCSYCGMSNFQSMSALNTHKMECKRSVKKIQPLAVEKNKAITIRRRVYICSVCGSYEPRTEVFQHMLEVHKLFFCLYDKCLKFCQSPEELMLHLRFDHKVEPKYCRNHEDFQREIHNNFFLLCINCQKVFTELDDPSNHNCPPKPKPKTELISNTNDPYGSMNRVPFTGHLEPSSSKSWDIAKVTASLKLNKDITMKPVNDLQSSSSCQYRNSNSQTIINNVSSESGQSMTVDNLPPDIIAKPTTENLNIKVPSDIEIKPVIPGEMHNQENKFEQSNESTIEIFPIPQAQPQKPKRTRTIIKKTIRKKIVRKKKKIVDNSVISNEINTSPEDSIVPPLSPPIIAPPPIVRSPQLIKPIESTPMESDDSLKSDNVSIKMEQANEERSASPQYSIHQEDKPPSPHRSEFMLALPERNELPEIKRSLSQDIFKKLQSDMDSDGESDDSQKLSLVVDENTNNSEDFKKEDIPIERAESNDVLPHESNDVLPHESNDVLPDESNDVLPDESNDVLPHESNDVLPSENIKNDPNEIPLASEDVAAMALTLDDKIENVPIEAVVKECVRTSCMSCNYCRHAVKIAVNGKQLALHLLSEHRYTPVKNETNDDVIRKLKSSLDTLQAMHFNAETYDSSDPSIHVPYDKESNFDCFQCSYVSASHKDLYTHKRKFHTKSLLLCIMCKKNFFSYSELICHICTGTYCADAQVYSVDINFRCCFCRLDTIPSAFRLMVHLRKSHHTCDICLEICTDQQKLSTHMWKHKLNHLCYRCGIAYASKPDITKHLFWKHGTESVLCKKCLQKKWPHVYHFCIPPTSFICEECNTSFSKAVALKVHKRIHGNDYPYSCPQCEKKFVSKKLISRHIDRHNAVFQKKDLANKSPDDNKDEIINVTDVDNKDGFHNENSDSNKEGDIKDKSHKKHKKEKDKKVVDVYDLPPLNLSSESDSSDEESPQKSLSTGPSDNGTGTSDPNKMGTLLSDMSKAPDMPKLDGMLDGDEKSTDTSNFLNLLKQDESGDELSERKPTASEPVSPFDSSVVNSLLPMGKDEIKNDPLDSMQNDQSFMNWESFYKTNSLNSNLPFPLCAMKSEVAYSIIMGDHDYCQQCKTDPIIKEEWPSTSNQHLSDDKLEEVTPLIPEKPQTPPPPVTKEGESASTPSKKKLKSPKKKVNKTPEDKNSSSSSDSSSDSNTSCSCATNCSCSSSSDSSSSSSSDSDSSTNDDKKDKRRKKKDKKLTVKPEKESETNKEAPQAEQEDEICPIPEPEDPPIRESELETDESTSDEEFYDRQPQIIANQLLAEKREKQINLSAPVNNGSASPLPVTPIPQQLAPTPPPTPVQPLLPQILPQPVAQENIPPLEQAVETPKLKPRAKRKRRVATPRTPKIDKPLPEPSFPKFSKEPKHSPFGLFQHTPPVRHKIATPILGRSPSLPEAGGSGSETDSTRLSKRRRVPNKFYGYSSGEEEEKLQQQQQLLHHTPKWRKLEMPIITHHTPKLPPTIVHPPPTPRIQLTVPKHIIRKPYQKQTPKQKMQLHHHRPPSSDSTDSGSDIDDRVPRPPSPMEVPKAEKDVYCYCRCPYDEVSEMIACDDTNCKIEWFHFECVGILVPPRGQWYCPDCRKARGLPT